MIKDPSLNILTCTSIHHKPVSELLNCDLPWHPHIFCEENGSFANKFVSDICKQEIIGLRNTLQSNNYCASMILASTSNCWRTVVEKLPWSVTLHQLFERDLVYTASEQLFKSNFIQSQASIKTSPRIECKLFHVGYEFRPATYLKVKHKKH